MQESTSVPIKHAKAKVRHKMNKLVYLQPTTGLGSVLSRIPHFRKRDVSVVRGEGGRGESDSFAKETHLKN